MGGAVAPLARRFEVALLEWFWQIRTCLVQTVWMFSSFDVDALSPLSSPGTPARDVLAQEESSPSGPRMASEHEAASLLDGLARGGEDGQVAVCSPCKPQPNMIIDPFHTRDGRLIHCPRCALPKNNPDLVNAEKTLAWNTHGHTDPSRHSRFDKYCEFVWHHQYPDKTYTEFLAYSEDPTTKPEVDYYYDEYVKMKRERGEKGRIADATWAKVPTPTWLFRDNYVDMQIEEPNEEFYSPEDFLKVFQKTPEEVGYSCQWVDTVTGKQWGCWVKEETRMKRKRIHGAESISSGRGGQLSRGTFK